ncbi:hypothetical protein [Pseudomonas mucidolens]|uniref:hypothetical protein n=1 Tax=Pseudomonas mucidolens TaxID=46679 RepID=UPI0030D9CA0B
MVKLTALFDDILFLISTDCFASELFFEFTPQDVEIVKMAAREAIPKIVHGGDNYYLCADFSPERVNNTRKVFFKSIQDHQVPKEVMQKVSLFYETLAGVSDEISSATNTIGSVATRMYWLDTDNFKNPITVEILNIISTIEPLGLNRESHGFEWEEAWLNSESAWDRYIMSLMDEIVEAPYLTFIKIEKFSTQLDYLRIWKKNLDEESFSTIKKFIQIEAYAELETCNAAAAREIDRIMLSI